MTTRRSSRQPRASRADRPHSQAKSRSSAKPGSRSKSSAVEPAPTVHCHEVIVVGAGFSGLCAAIKLREAGITDFVVLERADDIGGVWRDNTYPGCACDVPSTLYSFSFAPNPDWSRAFAGQAEILQYVNAVAEQFDVRRHVRLQHELLDASWNDSAGRWALQTSQGQYAARFIILACGPIQEPSIPDIEGMADFQGEIFHSARWNHQYDLRGKRVAVIGSGASAVQFVPEIQPQVQSLTLFQRTAHWILPKLDQTIPAPVQTVFAQLPFTQQIARGALYLVFESINGGLRAPGLMKQFQRLAQFNIRRAVKNPQLRQQLTPNYVIGCKRILQSNDWYPALVQPNVTVVSHGVTRVTKDAVIAADGSQHAVDAIILGTGFEVTAPPIAERVRGRSGVPVAQLWQGSPEGYMGTMVADCPNGFLMFGPNLAVSSSAFIIIEAQLNYIVDALKQARQKNLATIEINPQITARFNQKVQAALQGSVYQDGCSSYFIDKNGRNSTAWPWTTLEMRRRFSRFRLRDYVVSPQKSVGSR